MPVDTDTRLQFTQVLPTAAPREYVPRHLAADPEPVPQPHPVEAAEPAPLPLAKLYGHDPAARLRAFRRRLVAAVNR